MEKNELEILDFVRFKVQELYTSGLINETTYMEVDNAIDAKLNSLGINTTEQDI